jgi:hypothetical protein
MPNATIAAAFALELADLSTQRVMDPPSGALGYGTDLSCVTDLAFDYSEVDPFGTQGIAEALLRRYITPRGGLLDDPDYGLDVRAFLNQGATPLQLQAYPSQMRGEAKKDDRVVDADITVVYTAQSNTLQFTITVTPADPNLDPFTFVFSVQPDGAVLLESIT